MTRSILAALILTLGASTVSGQTSDPTPRPLVEWDVTTWAPESQAACGAFLTKFGILVSIKQQNDDVFQILWRGLALHRLSEMTDPETNELAWAAPIDMDAGDGRVLLPSCGDLFDRALKASLIPQSILDEAVEEANETMLE